VNRTASPPPLLCFDLDGTLTDSRAGIVNSFTHTLLAMGRKVPPPSQLEALIGPPLRHGLARLLDSDDPELIGTAVEHYRSYFSDTGMYENNLYPGIPDVLRALSENGWRLLVVTSRSGESARQIVAHFGLASFFAGVYGSGHDGSLADKCELLAHVLACESGIPARTVMIGDRKYDMEGAAGNGIPAVGVLWGFGDKEELETTGATRLCNRPEDLPEILHDMCPAQ
jgi:phosphoglycolate phosphatase